MQLKCKKQITKQLWYHSSMGEFISWHYSSGLDYYLRQWLFFIDWTVHYFSLPLLMKSLFAPWKRMVISDKTPGFNPYSYFQKVTFNLVSRIVGAMARIALFSVGVVILFLAFPIGGLGLWIWLVLPIVGYPAYQNHKERLEVFIKELIDRLERVKEDNLRTLFTNEAGEFVLKRLGLVLEKLTSGVNPKLVRIPQKVKTYQDLVSVFLNENIWSDEFFRKIGIEKEDLLWACYWWDRRKIIKKGFGDGKFYFGRPGIALELLFGYTPNLNQYSVDLGLPQPYSHRLIGREEIVSRMERSLTSGHSVIITGKPGVGKKTVVLEFASRASKGQLGPEMAYRRVLELDYNSLLSETRDINLKKTKFTQILNEAASAGNIILVLRDIHRLINPEVEGYDFTDVFEECLEKKELKVISIINSVDYERFIAPNLRIRKYFETVEVDQPSKEEAMKILIGASDTWENLKGVIVTVPALRKILEGSDRYITETPFPEKALELLDALVMYRKQKGGGMVSSEDVNIIMSEKTGISFDRLSQKEKHHLENLEEIIHERLVNQDVAVSFIARSLRARMVSATNQNRPIGSFLFLGPTGVGKTETAKVLARVYYGSEKRILRFDMSEYAGSEGLSRLIGSQQLNQPGVLTTSIKNQPASLLLLDEIEKAPREIINLFLALLDEGMMTDAFGRKINCRHLFVIGTSNAAAEYVREVVSRGVKGEELQQSVINYVMEKGLFSPEFLNRFDGVVVYEPLGMPELTKIARILLSELASNIKSKNIYLEITPLVCQKLAQDGYDPAFGARPMRRIVDIILGDLLGRAILSGQIKEGDRIRIIPGVKPQEYHIEKIEVTAY